MLTKSQHHKSKKKNKKNKIRKIYFAGFWATARQYISHRRGSNNTAMYLVPSYPTESNVWSCISVCRCTRFVNSACEWSNVNYATTSKRSYWRYRRVYVTSWLTWNQENHNLRNRLRDPCFDFLWMKLLCYVDIFNVWLICIFVGGIEWMDCWFIYFFFFYRDMIGIL